eukprot:3185935-Karenia_brevis.AAC.1
MGMAYQPLSTECKRKFEDTLESEAKVRNEKAKMQEFEGKERLRKEKKDSRKEESRGDDTTQEGKLKSMWEKKVETVEGAAVVKE